MGASRGGGADRSRWYHHGHGCVVSLADPRMRLKMTDLCAVEIQKKKHIRNAALQMQPVIIVF